MTTQRFRVILSTDGDVTESELADVLDALGYHGIVTISASRAGLENHEHPCPSGRCIDQLRAEGHLIPDGSDCCVCWAQP
jgi:hypothetical protein